MGNKMVFLVTNAAISINNLNECKWVACNSALTKRYYLSPIMAAILCLFTNGAYVDDVYEQLKNLERFYYDDYLEALTTLKSLGLLVSPTHSKHRFAIKVFQIWSKYNWFEAANYYISTYDYPFVDEKDVSYSSKDAKRMHGYFEEEPDFNRSKEYVNSNIDYKLPNIEKALESFDIPFQINYEISKSITQNDLEVICQVAFGKLRLRKSNNPDKIADIIRKTSPSGGSRHPTEGYIVILQKMEQLEAGIYHYSLNKNSLELLNTHIPDNIKDIFPGVFRSHFEPRVIFVLTSLFERNMYRYREPRTFRTIFIDVGHIAETIKILTTSLGLKYFAHTYMDEEKVENLLDLNKLQEGAIYSMVIA
jgi:SagB-type dehydrogenase family enzyme